MSTQWRDTSQIRKNIIAYEASQRSCENLSIVMGYVGVTKKAVETADAIVAA
jgi:hypothetical protein